MSNLALMSNKTGISAKAESIIKKLPANVREFAYAGETAASEYRATRNALEAQAIEAHEKAAEKCAVQFANLKKSYDPKKDEKAVCKTWGELAKEVFGVSPAWFSRLSCAGERWYTKDTETSKTLRDMFTPSVVCELLPVKDDKTILEAVASGELTADMTLSDVREWVDRVCPKPDKVEEKVVILNPDTGVRTVAVLSKFLEENGIDPDSKIASVKTGVREELSPTLSLEWTAHFYKWEDNRGCDVIWTHKNKTPRPTEVSPDLPKTDPLASLRDALHRNGFSEEEIEVILKSRPAE